MAEDDSSSFDATVSDRRFTAAEEDNSSSVDLWHAHPKQPPAAPYHMLTTKIERRRPENATIRRWMELGDQVLNGEPEANKSLAGRVPRPKPPEE